jgi:hypothetical protein
MSAINDALRRASAAQNEGAAPPPLPLEAPTGAVPPILSAVNAPPLLIPPMIDDMPADGVTSKKPFAPVLVVVFVLFIAAGAAGFYLWKRHQRATQTAQLAKLSKVELANAVAAAKPVASAPSETKQPAPETVAAPAVRAEPAVVPAAKPPPPPRIPVAFPSLRLQGIYYKPSNPSVVINGRILYLNDEVQGVTVAAIDSSSVTLVLSGQTNVLTLR